MRGGCGHAAARPSTAQVVRDRGGLLHSAALAAWTAIAGPTQLGVAMMKVLSKFVLVAGVAAFAIAGAASESEAAGKKRKMAAKKPAACVAWTYRGSKVCGQNLCHMQRCGWDGKWYTSLAMCWKPYCPK